MSDVRRHVDAVLATGINLARLPALLDELEADAFRRGWEARSRDLQPGEHLHRPVRRPDGSDGSCCEVAGQLPSADRFRTRFLRNLRGGE